jgi:hypothetical protein
LLVVVASEVLKWMHMIKNKVVVSHSFEIDVEMHPESNVFEGDGDR